MGLESICGVIGAKGKALAGTRPHSLGRYSHICCKALLPTAEKQIVQCCSQLMSPISSLKAAVSMQQQIMRWHYALRQLSRLTPVEPHRYYF